MAKRALVLGSGGPVGIAWQAGLLAGLAEAGLHLSEADFIVGTSAGSVVGAQLAMGKAPGALVKSIVSEMALLSSASMAFSGLPAPDFSTFISKMAEANSGRRPAHEVRVEIGEWALRAETISEEIFVAFLGNSFSELSDDTWPRRNFACTAVDTLSGEFIVWDSAAGADIKRAVAASCSVPGMFPPITIDGRRYMDGGTRSATNADLAKGYDTAVVVAVSGMAGDPEMAAQFRVQLENELVVLRESGTRVELIVPDASSIDTFGANLMDPRNASIAAETGFRQGSAQASALRTVWSGEKHACKKAHARPRHASIRRAASSR